MTLLQIPSLETPRLLLRGHRPADFEACAALWGDPRVTQHITGRPQTREETWARLLRYAGHWTWLGFGYWVVEERASGAFVGEVGFADFRRQIDPPLEGRPELGWVVAPATQGQGYATEALRTALAWADSSLPAAETCCIVAPENAASLRVAAKLGYRESVRTTYKGDPTVVFTRARGG